MRIKGVEKKATPTAGLLLRWAGLTAATPPPPAGMPRCVWPVLFTAFPCAVLSA